MFNTTDIPVLLSKIQSTVSRSKGYELYCAELDGKDELKLKQQEYNHRCKQSELQKKYSFTFTTKLLKETLTITTLISQNQSSTKRSRKRKRDDDDDDDKEDIEPKKKKRKISITPKRQPLKMKQIQTDLAAEVIRVEREEEMQNRHWNTLSWNFDTLSFGQDALVMLGWHLINRNAWHTKFNIAPAKLINFMYRMQEAYHNNPYHNMHHAADVTNSMYFYMECVSIRNYLNEFDRFISVMAAICHDVAHDGYNNDYHQRTESDLATRYKQPILENHHIAYTFCLISCDPNTDWISDLTDNLRQKAKKYLSRLILGTDMSLHTKHAEQIETMNEKLRSNNNANTDEWATVVSENDKLDLLAILLHAADIANAAKTRSLCVEWAKRCIKEFRVQGEGEKKLFGKESQPLFDKNHPLEKSQVGWIKFVMLPYFTPLNELLKNDIKPQIDNLHNNLKQWSEYKEYKDDSEKVKK